METPAELLAEARIGLPGECRLFGAKRKRQRENIRVAYSHQYNAPVNFVGFVPFDLDGQLDGGFIEDSSGDAALRRPDQMLIVCAGTRVSFISIEARKVLQEMTDFTNYVLCCRFRPDGKLMITSDANGHVRVIRTEGRNALRTYKVHTQPVRRVAFLSNTIAVSAGDDFQAAVYDISSSDPLYTIDEIHSDSIQCLSVPQRKPTGAETPEDRETLESTFLTASADGYVKIWDIRTARGENGTAGGKPVATLKHPGPVTAAVFVPGSASRIVTASETTLYAWNLEAPPSAGSGSPSPKAAPIASFRLHLGTVKELQITTDGLKVLTAASDFTVKLSDILDPSRDDATFNVLRALEAPGVPTAAAIDRQEFMFACGTADGSLTLWEKLDVKPLPDAPEEEFGFLPPTDSKVRRRAGTKVYFTRGRDAKPDENSVLVKYPDHRRTILELPPATERLLKSFQYQKAFVNTVAAKSPEALAGLLEELFARGAMDIATRGHSLDETRLVLDAFRKLFVKPYPAFQTIILNALDVFLDQNATFILESCDEVLVKALLDLSEALEREVEQKGPLIELHQIAAIVLEKTRQPMEDKQQLTT